MGSILDAVVDFISSVVDAIWDVVTTIWDEIVMPVLEFVAGLIGIEDETMVFAQKVSIAIYEDETRDPLQGEIIKTIIEKNATGENFFPLYMRHILRVKGQMRSYHQYGDSGNYIHGLPTMTVSGQGADLDLIGIALDTEKGGTNIILEVKTLAGPDAEDYFKDNLQVSHSYLPYNNTLTHDDPYSISRSDWTLDLPIIYNIGPNNYSIPISRLAGETKFWLEGPNQVTEGEAVTFTVRSNRVVPAGKTVTANFIYSGTAVDGVDYTEIANVIMAASTDFIDVVIETLDSGASTNFTINLTSITNDNDAFEEVTVVQPNSKVVQIMDDDSLMLTMSDLVVSEDAVNITLVVTLEQAAIGAFTVDYRFINVEAIGGSDFDNTPGTLNFDGNADETQDIDIPITGDVADDDYETFKVEFLNCSDPAIDVTRIATITIVDGSSAPIVTNVVVQDIITKPAYTVEESLSVRYYNDNDTAAEWFYWLYPFSDGTYADLEPSATDLTNMEMLPVAVLMKDKVFCDIDKEDPLYLTTRILMLRLGLPIDDFILNIRDNPDIDLINDVYVNFAMNPTTTHKLISKLLYFTYFELIVVNDLFSNLDKYSAIFREGEVNNATVWTEHSYTPDSTGVVSPEGEFTHNIQSNGEGKDLIMRHQTGPTTYDTIVVSNLNGLSAIDYEGFHKVAFSVLGDPNFTIPLSWFVFNKLTPVEHLEVYQHICRVDLYALQIIELEWYETSAFADLFEIVSWIITIWTLGAASGFLEVLKQLLIQYAIGELVIWIAEVTGNEALAAIVGLVAQIYLSGGEFSFEALVDPETLQELATNFSEYLLVARGTLIALDVRQAEIDAEELEEEELAAQNNVVESPLTVDFLLYLQSVDTVMFPAIQGQYEFNACYNYDSLVGDFHKNSLKVGVT